MTGRPARDRRGRRVVAGVAAALATPVAALVAGVVVTLAAAAPARAHDRFEGSEPGNGDRIATLPQRVVLEFNEPVLAIGTAVRVTGPSGDVAAGKPSVIDRQVRQSLGRDAPAGTYTVLWKVTSSDGHPISGRFRFTTTRSSAPAATPTPSAGASPSASPSATPSGTTPSGSAGVVTPSAAAVAGSSTTTSQDDGAATSTSIVWLTVAGLVVLLLVVVLVRISAGRR